MLSEPQTTSPTQNAPMILDRAFFGKDTCLTIQYRGNQCFFKWGKKTGEEWQWKNVKFSDVELGDLLELFEQKTTECKFFHSYNGESTQIKFKADNGSIMCSAGEFGRKIGSGERAVFAVLVRNIIWMMNLTSMQP